MDSHPISERNGNVDELAGTAGGVFRPTTLSEREIFLHECSNRAAENPVHQAFERVDVDLNSEHPAADPVLGDRRHQGA